MTNGWIGRKVDGWMSWCVGRWMDGEMDSFVLFLIQVH